jgi:hypothetical protein
MKLGCSTTGAALHAGSGGVDPKLAARHGRRRLLRARPRVLVHRDPLSAAVLQDGLALAHGAVTPPSGKLRLHRVREDRDVARLQRSFCGSPSAMA